MKNNIHLTKPILKRLLSLSVLLLSLSGVKIFEVGELPITPFYLMSPLLIITYIAIQPKGEVFNKRLLKWVILVTIISTAVSSYFRQSAFFHFLFYVLNGYILIAIGKYCSDDSDFKFLLKINKFIIYIYSIDVIIANLLFILRINNDFLTSLFPVYYDFGKVRYAAFTSEPSYLAIILTVAMMSLICFERSSNKLRKTLFFYSVALILARTTYGFICISLTILFLFFQNEKISLRRNSIYVRLFFLLLLVIIGIWFLQDNEYLQRLGSFWESVTNNKNMEAFLFDLNDNDGSAAMRLLPTFLFFQSTSWFSLQMWLGHGIGANTAYFTDIMNFSDQYVNAGYIPAAIYDLGIIGSLSFLYLIFKNGFSSVPLLIKLIFILSLVNCNVSTQLFWFCIIQLYLINIASKQYIK